MLLAILDAILPGIGFADDPVTIRQGRHGDMGRLVFDFVGTETYQTHSDGSVLTITFTPAVPIASVALDIPGVETLQGGVGVARLQLQAGADSRIYRLGNRVVVDTTRRPVTAKPLRSRNNVDPVRTIPVALKPAADRRPVAPVVQAAPAAQAAPAVQAVPAVHAVPAAPALAVTAAASAAPPAAVRFAAQAGAAAFRRGDRAIVVFDTSEIPDLTSLQSNPLFAGATLLSLQNAQVITIPLAAADALAVMPVTGGWQVAAVPANQPALAPPQNAASAVDFSMQSANQSIIISDPLTGGDLLVGTVTQGGDAADFTESGPGYAVLPAWLGVVVVPEADDLGLNASLKGFELVSAAANGLPLGALPAAMTDSAAAGSSLGIPRGHMADLYKGMVADQRAAAVLPQLGRLNAQITLAQDLLSLGMGPEAAGVLSTAVLENPAAQDNSEIAGMRAIANVLSHRSRTADFMAPGIVPSPELAFWRAAGALDRGQTGQGGPAIPGLIDGLARFLRVIPMPCVTR